MPIRAFTMKLKPGSAAEYKRRHDRIWPELAGLLCEHGISAYRIFHDAESDTLFAVQEVSPAKAQDSLSDDPLMRKWWAYMADIMEVNPDLSPRVRNLDEVFYMA